MTPFEWLAAAYFGILAAAGWRAPRRARGWAYAAGAILLVIVARFTLSWEARAWMPHAYLVLGYWIPAAFTRLPPDARFERWLERMDQRLGGARVFAGRFPLSGSRAPGLGIWELAYLLCYPLVPAAFTSVFMRADAATVTRFWIAVLLAGYACYGTLPWTAARPPRSASAREPVRRGIARFNTYVHGRLSHHLNTFPSGHVAVSVAAALVVCGVSPAAGAAFIVIATAIAIAAVVERYHYLVDVLLGVAVGALAWMVALYAVSFGSPFFTRSSIAAANVSISSSVV